MKLRETMLLIAPSVQYNDALHNILLRRHKQLCGGNGNALYSLKKCITVGNCVTPAFCKTGERAGFVGSSESQEITCFG